MRWGASSFLAPVLLTSLTSNRLLEQVSKPGNFLTQPDEDFTSTMDQVYYTSLWVSRAASRLFLLSPPPLKSNTHPKLVFCASILSFMSFAGYTSYSPSKYAIRGLADSLRNELQWLGVDVHTFFPTGIKSPGFEVEEARKPEVCKAVEGSDVPLDPKECAQHLLAGAFHPLHSFSPPCPAGACRLNHRRIFRSCLQVSRRAGTTSRTT